MKQIVSIALLATCLAVTSAKAIIVGASVGYLTDAKEAYVAARVGTQFSATPTLAQIGEFEIGYTDQSDSLVKARFMPLTANYRIEFTGNGKFVPYFGVGAGAANTRVKVSSYGISESDWSFAAQGFAGVSYKMTDKVSVNAGARYIWIDDVNFLGTKVEIGDDVSLELGLHVRF
jgi:opacity protein-like surface antigen